MLDSYDHRRVEVTEEAKQTRVFVDPRDRRSRSKSASPHKSTAAAIAHQRFREGTVASSVDEYPSSLGGSPAPVWSSPESVASGPIRSRKAAVSAADAIRRLRESSEDVHSMTSYESSPLQLATTMSNDFADFADFQLDANATTHHLGPAFVAGQEYDYNLDVDAEIAGQRSTFPTLAGLEPYPAQPASEPEPTINYNDIFCLSDLLNAGITSSAPAPAPAPMPTAHHPALQQPMPILPRAFDGFNVKAPELYLPQPPQGTVNMFEVSPSAPLGKLGYDKWDKVVGDMPWLDWTFLQSHVGA